MLAEAAASLELAQSRLKLAKNEQERNAPLAEKRAIADADFQKLVTDTAAREAEVAAAVADADVVVLNNTEKEVVKKLILDGVEQPPVATYGAIGSGAVNESAAFSGKGLLAFPPQGTLLVVK